MSLLRPMLRHPPPLWTSSPLVCAKCAQRLRASPPVRRLHTSPKRVQAAASSLSNSYFFANDRNDDNSKRKRLNAAGMVGRESGASLATSASAASESYGRSSESAAYPDTASHTITRARRKGRIKAPEADSNEKPLPLDASSALSSLASAAPALSLRRQALAYLSLTKPRLATLIVLTTTASYSLYPVPSLLTTSATHAPSLSTLTLLFLTTGTFSVIASANTLNMFLEPAYDAKMSRTRNRPLVRGLIRPWSALIFAAVTAALGTSILWYGVNPTTAVLGASNIVLYAFVYTPMKRLSIANTWVGAVVGAIPPLMGWSAAGGHYLTMPSGESNSALSSLMEEATALLFSPSAQGGWLLAALLFAWQFPHFNALSHPIRHEYAAAGYKMAVSSRPALNARVALRYSLLMVPVCAGLTYVGVTNDAFLVTSAAVNGWVCSEAWRFWKSGGGEGPQAAKAARRLFWASVWHLPIVLVLAMAQKKGLWDGVRQSLTGEAAFEDDEDDDLS